MGGCLGVICWWDSLRCECVYVKVFLDILGVGLKGGIDSSCGLYVVGMERVVEYLVVVYVWFVYIVWCYWYVLFIMLEFNWLIILSNIWSLVNSW